MARRKNSSIPVHLYIESQALQILRNEAARLSVRPGKLLSKLMLERSETFHCKPVQLIAKT
jgi:hypothetical protein